MISRQKRQQPTHNGEFRTPATFYSAKADTSLHGRDIVYQELTKAFVEVYNPSNKDVEVMKVHGVKSAVTIKMRDQFGTYQPSNSDMVKLAGLKFKDKYWQIVDIRPDFDAPGFITILLSGDKS